MKHKSGERTLLASVIMSSPGPLVVGIGLFFGQSSTQLADFIRRTAELLAIIVSWIVYRILHKEGEPEEFLKDKLERIANLCVGGAMCLSGTVMIVIAIFSTASEKGNVGFGLVIAVLGVIANTIFWLRYRRLNHEKPSGILKVQSKLYFAKSLVDTCVTTALIIILITPASIISRYVDLIGSIVVALYLIINGILTLKACVRGSK